MIFAKTAGIVTLSLTTAILFAGCDTAPVNTGLNGEQSQTETNSGDTRSNDAESTNPEIVLTSESDSDESSNQLNMPQAGDKVAVIETDFGTIKFKLFTDEVPEMTKNFEELAKAGNYDGTPFHRVVKDFMIQTGDFTNKNGTGGHSYKGPGTKLADEIVPSLKHLHGAVSMANAGPNTNGSQFFIVTNEDGTPFLNGGYTVFGQVYEGMDIAEKIQDLQVPGTEQPSETVNMTKVTVETI